MVTWQNLVALYHTKLAAVGDPIIIRALLPHSSGTERKCEY